MDNTYSRKDDNVTLSSLIVGPIIGVAVVLLFAIGLAWFLFRLRHDDQIAELNIAVKYCGMPKDMTIEEWKAIPEYKRNTILADCQAFDVRLKCEQ